LIVKKGNVEKGKKRKGGMRQAISSFYALGKTKREEMKGLCTEKEGRKRKKAWLGHYLSR